ncbi:RDD family protein [Paeniglutamicibacter antarcticus]|uniref:RDD domain-containing protein n=1 Tax=Paeniglutamicibacter antarcticus TaxID=494023 RepID=A0ABP9TI61_9MICC
MRKRTKRFAALGLDYLVIMGWLAVLGVCSTVVFLVRGELPDTLGMLAPLGSGVLYFFLLVFAVGVYLFKTESGEYHATWGKRKMGLEVRSTDGRTPNKMQILLRTIVKLVPWEFAHIFVWQMMYVFYREGWEAMPPVWVFVGLNPATAAALVYIVRVLVTGRGPHDMAGRTMVRLRVKPAA